MASCQLERLKIHEHLLVLIPPLRDYESEAASNIHKCLQINFQYCIFSVPYWEIVQQYSKLRKLGMEHL